MNVPQLLYGSHPAVTRASVRIAKAFVENGPAAMDYGPMVDTSTNDARLFLDPFPGEKGVLLYGPLLAFIDHYPDRFHGDPAFCQSLVAHWLQWDWSLLCLMVMPFGIKFMKRSRLAWPFLEAANRAWPAFVKLGTRFGPAALPRDLCGVSTTLRGVLYGYTVASPAPCIGPQSMKETHDAIRQVLSEGERELPDGV